jgi:glycosyltransferase involved in cell wall biosynthesis
MVEPGVPGSTIASEVMMGTQGKNIRGPVHVMEILGNAIVGGMEHYVLNLVRHMPAGQFKVSCVCPYESTLTAELRELGCQVFVIQMSDNPTWDSIQELAEIVQRTQVELIHAHLPRAHVLAGLVGSLTHVPVVATLHGMNVTNLDLGVSRTAGTHLITVCQRAYYQALALGVPESRLQLIYNGIDLDIFKAEGDGRDFRQAIGVPLGTPLVGFVGRLAWEKGPDLFVRAARRVVDHLPHVHFALVGEGPMEADLKKIIQELGLEQQVHLAGLWTKTAQIYPAFDVWAQTSRVEGSSLALLEAMACNRPVVAIGAGGVIEQVEAGTTGYILGPEDWGNTGHQIIELLNNPERAWQMGQAGRQRVESLFNLKSSVRATCNWFARLSKVKLTRQPFLTNPQNGARNRVGA